MDSHRQPVRALELLAHLVPKEVIERVRNLARQIEREDYVKDYMASKGLIIAVAGVGVASACVLLAVVLLKFLFRNFAPLSPWLKFALLLFGFAACIGITLALMYLLLSFLQRAALAKRTQEEEQRQRDSLEHDV